MREGLKGIIASQKGNVNSNQRDISVTLIEEEIILLQPGRQIERLDQQHLYLEEASVEFQTSLIDTDFFVPKIVELIGDGKSTDTLTHITWTVHYGKARRTIRERERAWYASYSQVARHAAACVGGFLDLARASNDNDVFLKFARQWGVLGIWPTIYEEDGTNGVLHFRESLGLWRRFARQYSALFDVGAELVSGKLGSEVNWKWAIDKRYLGHYGTTRKEFNDSLTVQRRVFAQVVSDLFRHVVTHPVMLWGHEDTPNVKLAMDRLHGTWDKNYLELRKAWFLSNGGNRNDDIFADADLGIVYARGYDLDPRNPHHLGDLGPLRPSVVYNVLITHLAATIAKRCRYEFCQRCGDRFTPAEKPRKNAPLLCSDDCREIWDREQARARQERKRMREHDKLASP